MSHLYRMLGWNLRRLHQFIFLWMVASLLVILGFGGYNLLSERYRTFKSTKALTQNYADSIANRVEHRWQGSTYCSGTLKAEFFYLNKFSSVAQPEEGLADYIHYYNHDRIKLKLKELSPVHYRTQPLAA